MANANAQTAFNFFLNKGYSNAQAAGIVGNLLGESSMNTGAVGDGGLARGIAQWHPDRWGYLANGPFKGQDHNSLDVQLEMVDWELKNRETKAFDRLMQAQTVDEATAAFIAFERPQGFSWDNPRNGHNYSGRLQFAQGVYGGGGDGSAYTPQPIYPNPGQQMPLNVYGEVSAPQQQSVVEVQIAEDAGPQGYGNFIDAVGANMESSGLTNHLIRSWSEGVIDPEYRLGEERGMALSKQFPDTYHDFLFSAGSERMLNERMKWAQEDMTRQARLQAGGPVDTLGAGFVAGVLDPLPLAAGVLTGGWGGAAVKGGWMARGAMGGVSGAAFSAGMDYASGEFNDNPYADPLMAGVTGGLFGTLGGVLARNPAASFEAQLAQQAEATFTAQARGMIPEPVAAAGYITGPKGNLGAARSNVNPDSLIGDVASYAIEMADGDVAYGFGGALRKGDVTGQMTTDSNPLTRLIGQTWFEEAAGFTDGSVVPDSVNSRMTAMHRQVIGNFNVEYLAAKDAYIKEGNLFSLNLTGKAQRADEFNQLVGDYVVNPRPSPDTSPHIVKAGGALKKGMADFAREMLEAGLWDGNVDENYLPLIANHQRIAELDRAVDPEVMQKFILGAIRNAAPQITDDLAQRMATGYWANIRKAGWGIDDGISRSLHLSDREGFKEAFWQNLEDKSLLGNDELEQVYDLLTGMMDNAKSTKEPGNGVGYLKRRTLMDYAYTASVPTRSGERINLTVRDLFQKDAEMLFRRYARSMSGRVQFAKTKITNPVNGELIADGLRNETDLANLIVKVKESYRQLPGDFRKKQKQMDNAVANIEFGWKRINGVPVYDQSGAFAQWSRRLKSMQFIRLMSNMGLNQVQEGWKIISLTGTRAALSQMPSIGVMVRGVNSGSFKKDRLLAELSDMTGIGLDHMFDKFSLKLDDDRIGESVSGKIGQAVDTALDFGQQLTAQVSFMRATSDYQQRWAMKAITQQMASMARKARDANGSFDWSKVHANDQRRLASIGLGEADAKLLFRNILDHSTFKGKKIEAMNPSAWSADAVSKYRLFLGRYTDRLVQANDFGALSKWMSHPVASMFVQFRSFVFGAWAKSSLWSLNHGAFKDPRMMVMLLGEIAAGAATYAVRQSSQITSEEGYEKFLTEMSDPVQMAKQGWARTATASVIPMFIDSLLMATPMGPQFGSARSSGSATDAWLGTPVADQIKSAQTFSSGAMESIFTGRSMTQGEVKSGVRAFVPLQNWVPITAGLGALIKDLPTSNR